MKQSIRNTTQYGNENKRTLGKQDSVLHAYILGQRYKIANIKKKKTSSTSFYTELLWLVIHFHNFKGFINQLLKLKNLIEINLLHIYLVL